MLESLDSWCYSREKCSPSDRETQAGLAPSSDPEVAHISASHGYAIVEFYDIRAAQARRALGVLPLRSATWDPEEWLIPFFTANFGIGLVIVSSSRTF